MTRLSVVGTISHGGVRLAWRQGGGGRPTEGWQDKSRSLGPIGLAADGRKISALARCSLLRDSLDFEKSERISATIAHRALGAS
jgi:hypothetical protein